MMPPFEWRDEYGHLSIYAFFTIQFCLGSLTFTLGYLLALRDKEADEARRYKD